MVLLHLKNEPPLIQAVFSNDVREVRAVLNKDADIHYEDQERRSALHAAAYLGNADIADTLLLSGALVNKKDNSWQTPLHRACRNQHENVAEVLLLHDADVTLRDRNWQTALHVAAANNALRCAELLLPLLGDESALSTTDRQGRSPLHHAALNGHVEMVQLLLESGAQANACDKQERRPLHWASYKGQVEVCRALIAAGADAGVKDKDRWTPLHCAAAGSNAYMINFLLAEVGSDRGVFVDAQNLGGDTPLHVACNNGRERVARYLIEHGANVNGRNNKGLTPLHFAAASSEGENCLESLIRYGADVNAMANDGRTPLHLASVFGRCTRVVSLIKAGGHIDARDGQGFTALHVAARHGHELLIKKLISLGAKADLRGFCKLTPLLLASCEGYADPVRTLVDQGASIQDKDAFGRTALHLAAASPNQNVDTISYLLRAGLSISLVDNFGRTPLHYACSKGYSDAILTILLSQDNCDVDAVDHDLRTPLHYALYANSAPEDKGHCVQSLLKAGARCVQRDKLGFTPFHYAAIRSTLDYLPSNIATKFSRWRVFGSGFLPLHLAALHGNPQAIAQLLADQSTAPHLVNALDWSGRSALYLACSNGHVECVKLLLSHGAQTWVANDNKMTPLHIAAAKGHLHILKLLMSDDAAPAASLVNVVDFQGRTPLMFAASAGFVECMTFLIGRNASVTLSDTAGRTALHRAVAKGSEPACKALLDCGASVWIKEERKGRTSVHLAALRGDLIMLSLLLSSGNKDEKLRKEDVVDKDGFTPLHLACYKGSEICAEVLLTAEHTILGELLGHKWTALHCAVHAGSDTCLMILVEKHGGAVDLGDAEQRTPLHHAAMLGHLSCCTILLGKGANIDAPDVQGYTPLMYAAEKGSFSVVEHLLKCNANVALAEHSGRNNALHLACNGRYEDIAGVLIDAVQSGEVLNAQNSQLKAALHIAARQGMINTVEKLLMKGASAHLIDENDCNAALSCAADQTAADCLALILCIMYPDAHTPRQSGDNYSSLLASHRMSTNNAQFFELLKTKNRHSSQGGGDIMRDSIVSSQGSDNEYF